MSMIASVAAVGSAILADNATKLETWEPTVALRYFKPDIFTPRVLEQQWICRDTGATQWRAVPLVEGED